MDLVKEKALSHFHTACKNKVESIGKTLHEISDINYSVKLSTSEYAGYTALHFIVIYDRKELIQSLLYHGADVTIKNAKNQTPIHLVASRFISRISIDYSSPTHSLEMLDLLLSGHENNSTNPENDMGLSHFHIACCRNNLAVIQNFLIHDVAINSSISLNCSYLPGYTPLHIAVLCDNIEIVQILLKYNANTNAKDSKGLTPLHLALQKNNNTIIDMIVADQTIKEKSNFVDYTGLSHFHIACMKKDKATIEKLLDQNAPVNDPISFNSPIWPGYTPLHFAIEFNLDFDVTELLLNQGADITVTNADGDSPIDYCKCNKRLKLIVDLISVKYGLKSDSFFSILELDEFLIAFKEDNYDQIKTLLELETQINNSIDLKSPVWPGYSMLHVAVEFKSMCIIKELLKKGANIDAKDIRGCSPVHLAFQKNCKQVVDLLFQFCNETMENPTDNRGLSHFHIACLTNNYNVVEKFLKNGVDVNRAITSDLKSYGYLSKNHRKGDTALHMVCAYEQCGDIVKLIVEHNADILIQNADGSTPIHIASKKYISQLDTKEIEPPDSDASGDEILCFIFRGDFTILDPLLAKSVENAPYENPIDSNGISHFHIACMRRIKVENFIENEVNVNALVYSGSEICAGYSPLHFAVLRGYYSQESVVKLLIDSGADINLKEEKGKTPLSLAVDREKNDINEDLIEILINKGADIHLKDKNGKTPLQYALTSDNKTLIYNLLSVKNVDKLNPLDDTGFSLIHFSCLRGNFKLTKDCLRNGADVNKQISFSSPIWPGFTPLHFAIMNDCDTNFIKVLLKFGADCTIKNAEGSTPVHLASAVSKTYDLQLMLPTNKNKNPVSSEGISHFHIACSIQNSTKIVEQFLSNGVDINTPVHFFASRWAGCTPLHIAINKRYTNLIVLLIIHGANVNSDDSSGLTPLHYFCKSYNYDFDILNMLLEHGANVSAKNVEGYLPVDVASKYNNNKERLLKILSKYTPNVNKP